MSYIITAEIDTTSEENYGGNESLVDLQVLSRRDGYIKFYTRGQFFNNSETLKEICLKLIDAGYQSFTISHSY